MNLCIFRKKKSTTSICSKSNNTVDLIQSITKIKLQKFEIDSPARGLDNNPVYIKTHYNFYIHKIKTRNHDNKAENVFPHK